MTNERKSAEQRRTEILDAAKSLFAKLGFEGTTTRAIAERAGVNEAILFRHFPTKLGLFHAVLQRFGFHLGLPFPLETLLEMPLERMLRVLLTHFLDMSWQHRMALKLMIATAARDPIAFGGLNQTQVRPRERLQTLLEAREAQGTLRPGQARAAASIIAAATLGFLTRSLRDEPSDWEAERTLFIDDLLHLLMPSLLPEGHDL